jgi:hypothetical protein
MSHKIDLQVTRLRLLPVRESTDGHLLTRLGWRAPLLPPGGVTTGRCQQAINGRWNGGEKALPNGRVEGQMTVLLQSGQQAGEDGLETFAADSVCRFPQDNERLADGYVVGPSVGAWGRPVGDVVGGE